MKTKGLTKMLAVASVCFILMSFQAIFGQNSFILSKNADFSTNDRVFSLSDTFYMKVVAPQIDFTDIEENEWELEAESGSGEFEGSFTNHLNGIYTANISLSEADPAELNWNWRARIEDKSGNRYETEVEIKIQNGISNEEVRVEGEVTAVSQMSVTVKGVTFVVNSETEIVDLEGNSITLDDITVGTLVEIRATPGQNGTLVASRIEIRESVGEDEVQVKGLVTAKDESSLVVAGLSFQVTGSTEIVGEEDESVEFSDIQIGFVVEVRGEEQANVLLATRIEIEDRISNVIEITGVIRAIDGESIFVSDLEFIATDEFIVTDNTEIRGEDGEEIAFEDLLVGSLVKIRADVQSDGTLIATRIELEDRFDEKVEVTGKIEEIGNATVVVIGVTFDVDVETEIRDENGEAISFGQLSVGMTIEIEGRVQPDGRLLARRIEVKDRIEDEVRVVGVIEQFTETSLTILGRTFGLTEQVIVFDPEGNRRGLSALFVGQTIELRGVLLPGGTLVAIQIMIRESSAEQIEIVGPIDSFSANTVQVIGINFFVDESTEYFDVSNNAIELTDLESGQTVEILALGQQNGTRLATRISVVDVVLLSSAVENVVFNGIMLLGQQVFFDSNTLILGKLNEFLTLNDVTTGSFVEIRAVRRSNNLIFGTKVKVLHSGFTTSISPSVDDSEGIPNEFTLLQNYPNPFNPTTTIEYEIPANFTTSSVKVELTVYNLLGQVVRTLVDETQTSGVYQTQWDGRDDRGVALPSGIYLYRLQAGDMKQTRRMMLLK